MTVFELTKKLQQYPGDARVVMNWGDGYFADIDQSEWHRIGPGSLAGTWEGATGLSGKVDDREDAVVLVWK